MKNFIKLDNDSDFVRDPNSKALLSNNLKALEASKKRSNRENQINGDINNMKEEINEIKYIQQEILDIVKKYNREN